MMVVILISMLLIDHTDIRVSVAANTRAPYCASVAYFEQTLSSTPKLKW